MKHLTLLLITTLLFFSGYARQFVGTVPQPEGAYILFKDGTRLPGKWEVLKDKDVLTKEEIVLDGKTYKTADIKKYSDGDVEYANVYGELAPKVFGDKLKVYRKIYRQLGVINTGKGAALLISDYFEDANGDFIGVTDYRNRKKWPKDFNLKRTTNREIFYQEIENYNTNGEGKLKEVDYTYTKKDGLEVTEK